MNCIVCRKPLENLSEDDRHNQPIGGTAFQTLGHYGSDFDPMDGTFLEINICDPCLKSAGADGMVLMGFPQPAAPRGPMSKWIPRET